MQPIKVPGICRQSDSALVVSARDIVSALKGHGKDNVAFYGVTMGARTFMQYLRLWKKERLIFLPVKESIEYRTTVYDFGRPHQETFYPEPSFALSITNGNGRRTRIKDGAWVRSDRETVVVLVE